MLQTPQKKRRQKQSLLGKARWAGYAAAGAATVLGTSELAEAGIYTGTIGERLDGSIGNVDTHALDFNNDGNPELSMWHTHFSSNYPPYWRASDGLASAHLGRVAATDQRMAINLAEDALVNAQPFFTDFGYGAVLAFGSAYGQFRSAETGYVGFCFDWGKGTQYGWLEVLMEGAGLNAYTLVSYGYADVGEDIRAGQVPEPGSLGLLATGALGLLLWRQKRRSGKPAA